MVEKGAALAGVASLLFAYGTATEQDADHPHDVLPNDPYES